MTVQLRYTVRVVGPQVTAARVNGQPVAMRCGTQLTVSARRVGTPRVGVSFGPRQTVLQEGRDDVDVEQLLPARLTLSDGDLASDVSLAYTPRTDSALTLQVNGAEARDTDWCVTRGGSSLPLDRASILAGDVLRWRGSQAGFELATGDTLALRYERIL